MKISADNFDLYVSDLVKLILQQIKLDKILKKNEWYLFYIRGEKISTV